MPSSSGPSDPGASVDRVRAALAAHGHPDSIVAVPETARTAEGAAEAVGCDVAQIAKSIIFRTDGEAGPHAVLIITSGANRVDPALVEAALGVRLRRADAAFVREATGFAIGGVAPVGHLTPPLTLVDEDLLKLDPIWAAAGSPSLVFRTTAADLLRLSGGRPARVRQANAAKST
jgi:prolyl-tRNA editing enzyme YbaK/EbsC (Cys-tRNA(Pro) deacylase)